MKAVLMSIKPKWVEKIINGEKTIELRKTAPKLGAPFKCYIYCTKNKDVRDLLELHVNGKIKKENGKVVAEFTCAKIDRYVPILFKGQDFYQGYMDEEYQACISHRELCKYAKGKTVYGWHISELKVYDTPKSITEFYRPDNGDDCLFHCIGNNCKFFESPFLEYAGECNIKAGYKIMQKPPQSWCYVEELGE